MSTIDVPRQKSTVRPSISSVSTFRERAKAESDANRAMLLPLSRAANRNLSALAKTGQPDLWISNGPALFLIMRSKRSSVDHVRAVLTPAAAAEAKHWLVRIALLVPGSAGAQLVAQARAYQLSASLSLNGSTMTLYENALKPVVYTVELTAGQIALLRHALGELLRIIRVAVEVEAPAHAQV